MPNTKFLTAKTTDLFLSSLYFFVFGVTGSILLNILTQTYEKYSLLDRTKEKSLVRLMIEIVFNIFFVIALLWTIRSVVPMIPFPLEGYGGYQHQRLSLPTVLLLSSMTLFFFQTTLMDKMREFNTRLFAASPIGDFLRERGLA
jgi:hypothetical protein